MAVRQSPTQIKVQTKVYDFETKMVLHTSVLLSTPWKKFSTFNHIDQDSG